MSVFTHALPTNNYGTAKFIVSSSAANGTHTTIASALTASSSGDTIFIRPGTYTEDLTLKSGVNLTSFSGDSPIVTNPTVQNVLIIGKLSASFSGSCSISNISLRTNSDHFLSVTGSSPLRIALNMCYLDIRGNAGIFCSNPSAQIQFNSCEGDLDGTASYFDISDGGVKFQYSEFGNSSLSTVPSTLSGGSILIAYSTFNSLISNSSASTSIYQSSMGSSALNSSCIQLTGTGSCEINQSDLGSGTASCITVGASSTAVCRNSFLNSSNANVITGAGTLNYGLIGFSGSSSGHNVTTENIIIGSAFQRIVTQVFTSSGTYTPTAGMKYCVIECVGGGGGGGGTANSTAGNSAAGGGGGGGEYSRKIASSATIGTSQTVTIPNAAAGGAAGNNAGGSPAATTLGSICTANGGTGGGGNPGNGSAAGGAGGTGGTGDFSVAGGSGGSTINAATILVIVPYGEGGSSHLGFGGAPLITVSNTTGNAGQLYGGGGGGGVSFSAAGAAAGGAGAKGVVIITEYL